MISFSKFSNILNIIVGSVARIIYTIGIPTHIAVFIFHSKKDGCCWIFSLYGLCMSYTLGRTPPNTILDSMKRRVLNFLCALHASFGKPYWMPLILTLCLLHNRYLWIYFISNTITPYISTIFKISLKYYVDITTHSLLLLWTL